MELLVSDYIIYIREEGGVSSFQILTRKIETCFLVTRTVGICNGSTLEQPSLCVFRRTRFLRTLARLLSVTQHSKDASTFTHLFTQLHPAHPCLDFDGWKTETNSISRLSVFEAYSGLRGLSQKQPHARSRSLSRACSAVFGRCIHIYLPILRAVCLHAPPCQEDIFGGKN